jgi:hypothetical protein
MTHSMKRTAREVVGGCSNNGSFSSSDQQDANGEAQTGTPEELQAKRKRGHGEINRRAGAGDV